MPLQSIVINLWVGKTRDMAQSALPQYNYGKFYPSMIRVKLPCSLYSWSSSFPPLSLPVRPGKYRGKRFTHIQKRFYLFTIMLIFLSFIESGSSQVIKVICHLTPTNKIDLLFQNDDLVRCHLTPANKRERIYLFTIMFIFFTFLKSGYSQV